MKRGWISIVAGFILGMVVSYFVLDYRSWSLIYMGRSGEVANTVNELDFDFITNAFGIILLSTAVVYGVLTLISKNKKINE